MFTRYLPLKSFGTRHEYPQVVPQPNLKLPEAKIFPFSSIILIFGVDAQFPYRYFSPARPMMEKLLNWIHGPFLRIAG
jgi:hypothetical protein